MLARENLVKYVILIYHNPASQRIWESFTAEQRTEGLREYAALNQALAESGEMIVSQSLADQALGRRVAVRDGQVLTTDAPLAETKEQLAGFYLVDCADLDRAVQIAAMVPEARAGLPGTGLVEVRPIMTYDLLGG
jgi:hypothetical protein